MKNKLVIAAFILSILALAASGVSLWMHTANARGDTGDIQSDSAPPANSLGALMFVWPTSFNANYKPEPSVYYIDMNNIRYDADNGSFSEETINGETYNLYIFILDSPVTVKSIGVADWKTNDIAEGVLLEGGNTYEITPNGSIAKLN